MARAVLACVSESLDADTFRVVDPKTAPGVRVPFPWHDVRLCN